MASSIWDNIQKMMDQATAATLKKADPNFLSRAQQADAARYAGQGRVAAGGGTVTLAPNSPGSAAKLKTQTAQKARSNVGKKASGGGGNNAYKTAQNQYAAAQAKAKREADAATKKQNDEGKRKTAKQNAATKEMADAQHKLLGSFGTQRDIKLSNITEALKAGDKLLLANYGDVLKTYVGSLEDNDKAESDSSFRNVSNAVRERADILAEAASQGAGETDLARSQLMALRNYSANQGEVNRSFFDTLRSVNNAVAGLNADTATGRTNLYNQSESDVESAWANFYNQSADTWTQIGNIENSNTNINEDDSTGYKKSYEKAAEEAAKAAAGGYKKKSTPGDWTNWADKGTEQERNLSSSNRAATINLSGPVRRAEGATLRKW